VGGKGCNVNSRLILESGNDVSAIDLNLLGISLVDVPLDNQINADISDEVAEDCGALVLVSETAYGLLEIVSPIEKVVPQENFMPLNTLDHI
jgi:hypothetical protein